MDKIQLIFILLVLFQVKHYIADFPLQGEYMLHKTSPGWDFLAPLSVHCLIHAALTLVIVCWWQPALWWLALVDFATHFIMDRIKSGPRYLGRFYDKGRASFWNVLGFDQMIHHLTSFFIIWVLISH